MTSRPDCGASARGIRACARIPHHRLLPFLREVRPALIVVGDENPQRQMEAWRQRIAEDVRVPFWTVDADVIVPSELLEKEQYAARTIRPRLLKRLDEFLVKPAARGRHARRGTPGMPSAATAHPSTSSTACRSTARYGPVAELSRRHVRSPASACERFVRHRLDGYDAARNHPRGLGTSVLSPYLHFGHIGPREVAIAIRDSGAVERNPSPRFSSR